MSICSAGSFRPRQIDQMQGGGILREIYINVFENFVSSLIVGHSHNVQRQNRVRARGGQVEARLGISTLFEAFFVDP